MSSQTKPGTLHESDGEEFYAVKRIGCAGCALRADRRCRLMPDCAGIIWLTKLDYIKHRLTS